ncbi:MAG: acyl carrier protein [Bdellovibrionota bacterium]
MQLEDRISEVLVEYARVTPVLPLDPSLSLRDDLAIESLSLVSIVVRLGEEFGVDVMDTALELGSLTTVKDLIALGRTLQSSTQH